LVHQTLIVQTSGLFFQGEVPLWGHARRT